MEIILKQDMPNLGNKDEIVNVKTGYATNYLIPQGIAIKATESTKKILSENIKQRAHKEAKNIEQAEELAGKLKDVKLIIGAKTSSTGKIFGSVTNIQIAEQLEKNGFQIDKKKISLENVKEVGTYKATIKLFKNITQDVDFEVVSE